MRPCRLRAAQYAVPLVVLAAVSAFVWLASGGRPAPAWVTGGPLPVLGWLYLVLLVARIGIELRRRRR
jgi:hypothetical protein